MRRLISLLLLFTIMATGADIDAKRRTSRDVKRDKQRTERQIADTRRRIRQTDDETRRQLNRLDRLRGDIARHNDTVAALNTRIAALDTRIAALDDSVDMLAARSRQLKAAYARALRDIRSRRQGMSDMAFIFSAESFSQAWRRMRYLRQTARFNESRAREIDRTTHSLDTTRQALRILREEQRAAAGRADTERRRLASEQTSADALVTDLRRRRSSLDRELTRRRNQAAALDRELNRIIEREIQEAAEAERRARAEAEARAKAEAEAKARAEARARADAAAKPKPADGTAPAAKPAEQPTAAEPPKPATKPASKPAYTSTAEADRRLTGSFASNKGRLLFPVAGKYTITSNFGTNTHPGLARIKVDNLGIDIETPAGTSARAVFDGVVSSIFRLEGYHNIIILRHGSYLTVYGGLDRLSVKKGDKVKAGQTLGGIYIDRSDDNRTRLHFEIRHEKQKLNPVEWVR